MCELAEINTEQKQVVPVPVMINADTAKTDLQPGEKGFTIVLFESIPDFV